VGNAATRRFAACVALYPFVDAAVLREARPPTFNTRAQAPPPKCFSLIPNVKVFGMDATAANDVAMKVA
jgi:hypothetical protein